MYSYIVSVLLTPPLHQARSQACLSGVVNFHWRESRGTKYESLLHTLRYDNQMYKFYAKED